MTYLFAFGLRYNSGVQPGSTALYNGNIAETHWKTSENNIPRMYAYTYDGLNRLRNASYKNLNNPVFTDALREAMNYDKNGNITHLERYGKIDLGLDSAGTLIDDLTYSYGSNSNQLKKVVDLSNSTLGFKDDSTNNNDPQDDYTYDQYGNMTLDQNKTITSIVYNHLNLPLQINFANGGTIKYVYDATGVKQSKSVTVNNTGSTTKYLNGFQYNNDVLQFFPTAEGYVNHTITNNQSYFNYVYHYTDHLGNIRLSYTWDETNQDISILEEHHYYPFGLELINLENTAKKAYSKEETVDVTAATGTIKAPIITQVPNSGYQYQYNGKEYQDELGLNVYLYGFRDYDPAVGRWCVIDQLSEKYHTTSLYAFVQNNPIINREIDGRWFDEKNEKKAQKYEKKIDKQINKLNSKIAKLQKQGKGLEDLKERVTELGNSKNDITSMRNEKKENGGNEYRFDKAGGKNDKAGGKYIEGTYNTRSTGDKVITMFIGKDIATSLHEIRHGGQNARGEFDIASKSNYGVSDEVSAYRAQYAYSGSYSYNTHNFDQAFTNKLNRAFLDSGYIPPSATININNISEITSLMVNDIGYLYKSNNGNGVLPLYPPEGISTNDFNNN